MIEPIIEWRNVSHQYTTREGVVEVLEDVDVAIRPGEFVSIIGTSGCGKSTLLLLTAGLLQPSRGDVLMGGARVRRPTSDLSIVFQQDMLLDWRTCIQNVLLQAEIRRMDRREARTTARELFRRTGLAGFEDKWPQELSGGMRQRVALCRALLPDPPLLLMDEPFGALDALTRAQMVIDLERLVIDRQKTVLFVTHDIEEAVLLGDRVLVLSPRPARVVADVRIDVSRPRGGNSINAEAVHAYAAKIAKMFESLGVLRVAHAEA